MKIRSALATLSAALGRYEAEQTLLFALHQPLGRRQFLLTHADEPLGIVHWQVCCNILRQRQQQIPLAYILGRCFFYNVDLNINRYCLIPRQDSELLVELALRAVRGRVKPTVLDMATGSGAIILALQRAHDQIQGFASDICPKALHIANMNRQQLGLSTHFIQSNWGQGWRHRSFDCITVNPPYVCPTELELTDAQVGYEPYQALFADDYGLGAIKALGPQAHELVNPGGWLFLEHGFQQGPQVRQILLDAGFKQIQTHQDLGGRDRVTQGIKPC